MILYAFVRPSGLISPVQVDEAVTLGPNQAWLPNCLGKTAQFSIRFKAFLQMELVGKIHNFVY